MKDQIPDKKTKRTGYIEGYFGRQLNWAERRGILEHLSSLNMNTYLYAPKEDPYHRVQWRHPYPEEWRQNLEAFTRRARDLAIEVIPALAPGLTYDYLNETDYRFLLEKFKYYFEIGITSMALLMDDIPTDLPQNCRGRFNSLGEAHGKLLQRLQEDLRATRYETGLLFCPTVYSDQFTPGEAVDSDYIQDLVSIIPRDIPVFWTGNRVVPAEINAENTGRLANLFNKNIILWDNYYANDYTPYRLFLGPLAGRDRDFTDSLSGFMINPTGLYHTDKMLLSLTGEYLKTGAADLASWRRAVSDFDLHPDIEKVISYFWSPFMNPDPDFPTPDQAEELKDFYDEVVVKWQNPLRREWFPYLMSLLTDMNHLHTDYGKDDRWISMRFSPVIARKLRS